MNDLFTYAVTVLGFDSTKPVEHCEVLETENYYDIRIFMRSKGINMERYHVDKDKFSKWLIIQELHKEVLK